MNLMQQMLDAQRRFQLQLLAKANVVGVGIGYRSEESDELALITMVERKLPVAALSAGDLVPPEIDGAPTDVIEVGSIRAQLNDGVRDRWRPSIPPGVSIGHPLVTAGTYGALVYDNATGERLILSNNHVLANSNGASLFDPILQPAATDGGTAPGDNVAQLYRYLPLRYIGDPDTPPQLVEPTPRNEPDPPPIDEPPTQPPPNQPPPTQPPPTNEGCANLIISLGNALARLNDPDAQVVITRSQAQTGDYDPIRPTTIEAQQTIPLNTIDAALARPARGDSIVFSDEILNIGRIDGVRPPSLGLNVRKTGRTTGTTVGMITAVNATIDVNYTTPQGRRTARFVGQVTTTGMSQGGDSGSLIVAQESRQAVGLLFAGSGTVTVFTPITPVLEALKVTLTPPRG